MNDDVVPLAFITPLILVTFYGILRELPALLRAMNETLTWRVRMYKATREIRHRKEMILVRERAEKEAQLVREKYSWVYR